MWDVGVSGDDQVPHSIQKTVIGSFPRLEDRLEGAIERAIDIQLGQELEIVSDGEQRADMISYFEQIPGLVRDNKGLGIAERIRPLDRVEGFHKLKDFLHARSYLDRKGKKNVGLKVGITGPVTLGFTCAMNKLSGYRNVGDRDLYSDLVRALRPLIDELLRLDAYVQLDEPGLSAGFMDPVQAAVLINEMISDLDYAKRGSGKLGIHVCGDLTRIPSLFNQLMKTEVDVVSLAFAGEAERRNLQLISEDAFVEHEKWLGLGCIPVTSLTIGSVSPVQDVVELLNQGTKKVSPKRIAYVHPDCGLRNTPLDVAEKILERMRLAARTIQF